MALPAVVPAPASIATIGEAAFSLRAQTEVVGDADAVAAARALITTRTGLDVGRAAGTAGRAITLQIDGNGDPESYRLRSSAASVTVTGADAAGLHYGIQTLGQLISGTDDGWELPAVQIGRASCRERV